MMESNKVFNKRLDFPWLQNRIDPQGLDGWWMPCFHHLFRDALYYHKVSSPLQVLFRPLQLEFFIDKNYYPWLWDAHSVEFQQPLFNQGVRGHWITETRVDNVRQLIHSSLARNHIPIVYMEWFHAPFTTHYKRLRGNLHAVAILDFDIKQDKLYILDRTPLPAEQGGFAKDRGWVAINTLQEAIEEKFGLFDYFIEDAVLPWPEEARAVLLQSITAMRLGKHDVMPSSDRGLAAIHGFAQFLQVRDKSDIDGPTLSHALGWHVPPCIRKFVIGPRRILDLVISSFADQHYDLVQLIHQQIMIVVEQWDQIAFLLALLGHEQRIDLKEKICIRLTSLASQEDKLVTLIEQFAYSL